MGTKKRMADNVEVAMSHTKSLRQELQALRQRLERQGDLFKAMWELMKTKLELTDDDLLDKLNEISSIKDLGDTGAVMGSCPKCSRPLQENSIVCVYCGEEVPKSQLFMRTLGLTSQETPGPGE